MREQGGPCLFQSLVVRASCVCDLVDVFVCGTSSSKLNNLYFIRVGRGRRGGFCFDHSFLHYLTSGAARTAAVRGVGHRSSGHGSSAVIIPRVFEGRWVAAAAQSPRERPVALFCRNPLRFFSGLCQGVWALEKARVRSRALLCERWLAKLCSTKSQAELVHLERAVGTSNSEGQAEDGRLPLSSFLPLGFRFRVVQILPAPQSTGGCEEAIQQPQDSISNGFYLLRSPVDETLPCFLLCNWPCQPAVSCFFPLLLIFTQKYAFIHLSPAALAAAVQANFPFSRLQ